MSEMIERVAKAIALAALDDETRAVVNPETWPVAESYCDMARAAIEAMREPTERMMEAGGEECLGEPSCDEVWQTMIDAALSDSTKTPSTE